MRLRTNEEIAEQVSANSTPEVTQKVIAAHVVRASGETADGKRLIEASALRANSSHQLAGKVFPKLRNPDSIEIVEDWTKRIKALVESLAGPPRYLAIDSKLFFDEEIATETRIRAARQRLG